MVPILELMMELRKNNGLRQDKWNQMDISLEGKFIAGG
jgi:hypothetical protein